MQTVPASCTHVAKCLKYKHTGTIEWGPQYIRTSDINKDVNIEQYDENLIELFHKYREQKYPDIESELLESELVDVDDSVTVRAAVIDMEEDRHVDFISQLDVVIDSVVFPNNRPTRSMQDYHGPTFSLKGFIKFICTDGQYKKIYENMIGHPRKDYTVSVILDTSTSMAGVTAVGAMKIFIGLACKFDYVYFIIFLLLLT